MISTVDVIIALGANLNSQVGAPIATLTQALRLLERRGVRVKSRSRWWSTPAFPPGSGPSFVNAAAVVETTLEPENLLKTLHEVEAKLGRERRARWEARVVDLDLIAYGDAMLPDAETLGRWIDAPRQDGAAPERLVLPHPRLQERGFVLAPMRDVAPEWRHPLLGLSTTEMLARLPASALKDVAPIDDAEPR